jgi:2-oxoglutarate/2-oxoacid ferredoxin oxidoreductase subunit alpha
MSDVTIGIGGAAGDGIDKSSETLAKSCARSGLYAYGFNSYQSVIRGGHIWLRTRIGQEKVKTQGDHLHALIALNQDSIERHAPEVEPGGAILFNSDKLKLNIPVRDNVLTVPLPISSLLKPFGAVAPIMQNTVALGALVFLFDFQFEMTQSVLADTFSHKGQAVIDQNVGLAKAGYDYAKEHFVPLGYKWKFSTKRRPYLTGNQAFSMGAVAGGCRFYSAYPMTPASGILTWMAEHSDTCGVVVKQMEDELAVANVAIGAGYAGARAMCATSGGGFALMTEAIGMAGMIEAPVVFIEVARGGPSTGIPTKQEQGDLNCCLGAGAGDFPRVIIAPTSIKDAFDSSVEALNLADKYQMPVIIVSDLQLSEHPETVEPEDLRADVTIDRGELVTEWNPEKQGKFHRYALTASGVSPRPLPGTANTIYTAPTDEHDEDGILISDVFCNWAIRRKMNEKRMKKMDLALKDLPAPKLVGPANADVTLIGWGSSEGLIEEVVDQLTAAGVSANHIQFKYMLPFHVKEATAILKNCKHTICIEGNGTGQFANHLRGETGHAVNDLILKYDGEPFEPAQVTAQVRALLAGKKESLDVSESEAREIAYHYVRVYLGEEVRPSKITQADGNGRGEKIWKIQIVSRESGEDHGELQVGVSTGSTYSWQPVQERPILRDRFKSQI